jgi:arginase family enzyme
VRVNRPNEPPFAGGGTFSKLPLALSPDELDGFEVAVVGAPTDEAVSNRPGARYGPRAIRLADPSGESPPRRPNLDVGLDPFEVLSVVDYGDPPDGLRGGVSGRRARRARRRPLVADRVGADRLGLIHFDAHADNAAESYQDAGVRSRTRSVSRRPISSARAIRRSVSGSICADTGTP